MIRLTENFYDKHGYQSYHSRLYCELLKARLNARQQEQVQSRANEGSNLEKAHPEENKGSDHHLVSVRILSVFACIHIGKIRRLA